MKTNSATAIALLCLIGVAAWVVWPDPIQRQYGMTREAKLEHQHQLLTAVLLKHLPVGYMDSIAAYPDSALASIAMPGIDPDHPDFTPTWRGTIGELRSILKLREIPPNPMALPQEESP